MAMLTKTFFCSHDLRNTIYKVVLESFVCSPLDIQLHHITIIALHLSSISYIIMLYYLYAVIKLLTKAFVTIVKKITHEYCNKKTRSYKRVFC